MRGRKTMEDEKIKRIRKLRKKGLTYQQIADRLDCAVSTTYNYSKDIDTKEIKEKKNSYGVHKEEKVDMVVYGILMRDYPPPQISKGKNSRGTCRSFS